MVRNYKRKKDYPKWDIVSMENAVSKVKNKEMSARKAAQLYEITRTCLLRRLKKDIVTGPRNDHFKPVFNPEQKKVFVNHILDLESRFYGLTLLDVRKLAFDLAEELKIEHCFNKAKRLAGKDWLSAFRKRHTNLSVREPESTSIARAAGFNKLQVQKFFDILKSVSEKYSLHPQQIYNADETGISTVPIPNKIIALKGKKQVGRIVSAERGFNITVTCTMSASGQFVPPFFLFPRQRMSTRFMKGAPPGSIGKEHFRTLFEISYTHL